jgi:hypothetical protein
MNRWKQIVEKPNEQTFALPFYGMSYTGPGPMPANIAEAEQQLRHAAEQIKMTQDYPGRKPPPPPPREVMTDVDPRTCKLFVARYSKEHYK